MLAWCTSVCDSRPSEATSDSKASWVGLAGSEASSEGATPCVPAIGCALEVGPAGRSSWFSRAHFSISCIAGYTHERSKVARLKNTPGLSTRSGTHSCPAHGQARGYAHVALTTVSKWRA